MSMMQISPIEVCKIYTAIKLHYTKVDFNAASCNYVVKLSQKTYDKKSDKYYYAKIARKHPERTALIAYAIGNLSTEPSRWIGNFSDKDGRRFVGNKDSLEFVFERDLRISYSHWKSDIANCPGSGQYPPILQGLISNTVSLEFVSILGALTEFHKKIDVPLELWKDTYMRIEKHHLLLSYDKKKIMEIIKEVLEP